MNKKILDEKGRLFGVINIVDVIVIILAIVIVCGVYVKFSKNEKTSTSAANLQAVEYQLEIKSIRSGTAGSFRSGDLIFDKENDVELGTVTNVQISDATLPKPLADGTYVVGNVEGRYDVILTIEGNCQIINGRYYINKSDEISVGHDKRTYTKYCEVAGRVIDIEKKTQTA